MGTCLRWEMGNYSIMHGYAGDIKLFFLEHNSLRPKGVASQGDAYRLGCSLPGYKPVFYAESIEAGKEKAEKILAKWVKATGLSIG